LEGFFFKGKYEEQIIGLPWAGKQLTPKHRRQHSTLWYRQRRSKELSN
jgi:hypothetical protein